MNNKPADGLGTQLRRLLELLDGDLESLYREQHPFYVPRYTPVMKALESGERLTIKEIAARSSISHSAASQTIAKMTSLGLLETSVEGDRRSRTVYLTASGRDLLPWLQQRWLATRRAADELDAELSSPLSQLLAEAISLLEADPFRDRIAAQTTAKGDDSR